MMSWFKTKAMKGFSSSRPSKSTTGSTSTHGDDARVSQDKAAIMLSLQCGSMQPAAGEPIVEESVEKFISRPIAELWDEAYDELCKKEKSLVADYEAQLSKMIRTDSAVGQASAITFSGLGKLQRCQQMKVLLDQKIKEIEEGKWKLKFKDRELAVKDLVDPVVGIIDWARDFIGTALEPSPYGSMVWAGVCVLLPEAARAKDLDNIARIISRCTMREALYCRRYESTDHSESKKGFITSHISYRDALRILYVKILSFQATSVCFLYKNTFKRITADMVKWNDWDNMLAEIKEQENELKSIEEQWRDMKYDEEYKLHNDLHEQRMRRLSAIEDEVSRVSRVILDAQKEDERDKLLKWLSSVDPSTNYNSARRNHALSTGDWLVKKSSDFKEWEKAQNSLLWLYGKAGAGKSFLSSSIIHHLEKSYNSDPYTALAYFFFSFSDQEKQKPENMLRSLIVQLCGQRPDTPKPLLDLGRYRDVNHQPDLESLETTLRASTQDFKSVYLVVDALDECPLANGEREKLLKLIGHVHKWTLTNLHVLCTSRQEPDIEAKLAPLFSGSATTIIDLQKRREKVNQDIHTYIDQKINSSDFRSWPPKVKKDVKAALTEKADGMFQYVALQLKALEVAKSPNAVTQALEDLPAGLDETYNRALLSIDPRQQTQAIRSLKWLACSVRPLTVNELAEASIIDPKASPPFDRAMRLFSPLDVLNFLPALVTVYYIEDSDSSLKLNLHKNSIKTREVGQKFHTIRLAHFSIKEFLISDRIKDGPASCFSINDESAHIHIAESCLLYHLHVSDVKCQMHTVGNLLRNFSLWSYAARSWIEHTEAVPRESWPQSLLELTIHALKPRTESLLKMIEVWLDPAWNDYWHPELVLVEGIPSPLYYTAYRRYLQSSSLILKHKLEDIDANGCYYSTAINAAYHSGHESFMQLLLEALGCKPYDHLIEVLTTYRLNNMCHLMFPFANCNLRQYWENQSVPNFDTTTVLWSLKQMKGIACALHLIHNFQDTYLQSLDMEMRMPTHDGVINGKEWYWCHGDIRAENIFWFRDGPHSIAECGILKIADFGLLRLCGLNSRYYVDFYPAPTYSAPECHSSQHISRANDIWSLGCVYLEFITWLLKGSKEIMEFSEFRSQDRVVVNDGSQDHVVVNDDFFYTIIEDSIDGRKAEVRKTVIEWANLLHKHKNCSAVIHSLIDLIMDQLLVVDVAKRIKADLLQQYLIEFLDKAEGDSKYLLDPVPRGRQGVLSPRLISLT